MRVVVDTNILFSMLLAKHSSLREIIHQKAIIFYAPNFLFTELFKHKEKILQCSTLEEGEIYAFINRIFEHIHFV